MTMPIVFAAQGKAVTTSIAIAEFFQKRHDNVIRSVRALIAELPSQFSLLNFEEIEVIKDLPTGQRKDPAYELTRDAFTLLAMGFTGKKALEWKLKYIQAFNDLEAALTQQAKPASKRVQEGPILPVMVKRAINRRAYQLSRSDYERYRKGLTNLAIEHSLCADDVERVELRQGTNDLKVLSAMIHGFGSLLGQAVREIETMEQNLGEQLVPDHLRISVPDRKN